jgi:hypothetical protein
MLLLCILLGSVLLPMGAPAATITYEFTGVHTSGPTGADPALAPISGTFTLDDSLFGMPYPKQLSYPQASLSSTWNTVSFATNPNSSHYYPDILLNASVYGSSLNFYNLKGTGYLDIQNIIFFIRYPGMINGANDLVGHVTHADLDHGLYAGSRAHDYFDVDIKIAGAPPVPEPSTMLLLVSGLTGLASARKKFRKGRR